MSHERKGLLLATAFLFVIFGDLSWAQEDPALPSWSAGDFEMDAGQWRQVQTGDNNNNQNHAPPVCPIVPGGPPRSDGGEPPSEECCDLYPCYPGCPDSCDGDLCPFTACNKFYCPDTYCDPDHCPNACRDAWDCPNTACNPDLCPTESCDPDLCPYTACEPSICPETACDPSQCFGACLNNVDECPNLQCSEECPSYLCDPDNECEEADCNPLCGNECDLGCPAFCSTGCGGQCSVWCGGICGQNCELRLCNDRCGTGCDEGCASRECNPRCGTQCDEGCDTRECNPTCGTECEPECGDDCNHNGFEDQCDIRDGRSHDCNSNFRPDECDIADGISQDCDGNNVPDECEICRIDMAFVLDTSGSMSNEIAILCGTDGVLQNVLQSLADRIAIEPSVLGITEDAPCTFMGGFHGNVADDVGKVVPGRNPDRRACNNGILNHFESWGPTTAIVAEDPDRVVWRTEDPDGRIIFPVSDEGPCEGGGSSDACEPADAASIRNAVWVSKNECVLVGPITGDGGTPDCVVTYAEDLARQTGGVATHLRNKTEEEIQYALEQAILTMAQRACYHNDCNLNGKPDACDIDDGTSQDQDGDSIPDECGAGFNNGKTLCRIEADEIP